MLSIYINNFFTFIRINNLKLFFNKTKIKLTFFTLYVQYSFYNSTKKFSTLTIINLIHKRTSHEWTEGGRIES